MRYYKKSDADARPLEAILTRASGPIDLSAEGVQVKFYFSTPDGSTVKGGACTVTNGVGGVVQYPWESGDDGKVDGKLIEVWRCEFKIIYASTKVERVPNDCYDELVFLDVIEPPVTP